MLVKIFSVGVNLLRLQEGKSHHIKITSQLPILVLEFPNPENKIIVLHSGIVSMYAFSVR